MGQAATLRSETLVFVPQLIDGTLNHSWFSPSNWFTLAAPNKLIHANRLPLPEDTAQITGLAIAAGNSIGLDQLIVTASAVVEGGNFTVQGLSLSAGATLRESAARADRAIRILGPLVQLESTRLVVEGGGFALLSPDAPFSSASLTLARGSEVFVIGELILTHGSQIGPLDLPQSRVTLPPTGMLSSSGDCVIRGSAASPLILDVQGSVRGGTGSLRFLDPIEWRNAGEPAQLSTLAAGALIEMVNSRSFNVPEGARFKVKGPGLVRLSGETRLDGILEVGAMEQATGKLDPGRLEIATPVRGIGSLRVLGTPAAGSALLWQSHSFEFARLDIDRDALFTIAGATTRTLSGIRVFNGGVCLQTAAGSITMEAGAQFENLATAQMDIQADASYEAAPGSGARFINRGTLRKLSSGITRFGANSPPSGPDLDNLGLMEIRAGQLNVFGGDSSGRFDVAQDAKLFFWGGTHILQPDAAITGPGWVTVAKGATETHLHVLGDLEIARLELGSQGFIDGPGNIRVLSEFQWTSGGLTGSGNLEILPGTPCRLTGNGEKTLLGRTLLNHGIATWSGSGALVMSQGALFDNAPDGSLELSADTNCQLGTELPKATFVNRGRFTKTQGSFQSVFRTEFQNQGDIDVLIKEIDFRAGFRQSAGRLRIAADASVAGPLLIEGGLLMGNGSINGSVTNSGTVSPGMSPGRLVVAKGFGFLQNPDGRFICELGGQIPGVNQDQLALTGEARLAGKLEIQLAAGFEAKSGDRFTVMTYASRLGAFDAIILTAVPAGTVFVPRYTNNSLVLIAAAAQIQTDAVSHPSQMRLSIPTVAGLHYTLEAADSLPAPVWTPVMDWTGDGTSFVVSEPMNRAQRFYRLRLE